MKLLNIAVVLPVLVALAPMNTPALTLNFNTLQNGAAPTSVAPWLTAQFTQNGANTVRLTLTSSLEVSGEFIDAVAFNVDPNVLGNITITKISAAGGFQDPSINGGPSPFVSPTTVSTRNNQTVPGTGSSGLFDLLFGFVNAQQDRFDGITDSLVVDISATGLLDSSFNFGTSDTWYTGLAHVGGIPNTGGGPSGGIIPGSSTQVPDGGSTLALAGLAMAALGLLRRRLT